ncbi:MAG TPA: Cof-type HAD-IIB family hydrolase [Planctomycetota bacterium]|nr:Cof-type HAD-IIB family hydrolase [Planctomycetota bacterium]HRR81931.1 Cof-type HAD-IIB family hydrolase [Planctomycetota bacterium]HRT94330.1 Cof-type HAD-IIB family hydrolase [Planctomycetota bacterium]
MPRYRLLAVDIDGTLLDSASHLRPAVRDALRRAVASGLRVVLCTGRRYRTAIPIAQELGLALPLICHSGALVKDTATHGTLLARHIERDVLGLLLDSLDEFGLAPMVYTDTFEVRTDFYLSRGARLTHYHTDYLLKNDGWYRFVGSLRDGLPAPAIQVCTFGELSELQRIRPLLRERLAGRTTCHLLSSAKYLGNFLEFQTGTASKWAALSELLHAFRVAPEEVVAIGDDENDISMLQAAGLGVAMGNAAYPVKSAAHVVAPSNDEDGVACVVGELLAEA